MEAEEVWKLKETDIVKIINHIKTSFKLYDDFFYIAQNIFYSNFEKYYENDNGKYIKFFFSCLSNFAKNKYREKVRAKKFITDVELDGKLVEIFDIIEDEKSNFIDKELMPIEINDVLKKRLDDVEYFTFLQVVEGWNSGDIAKMLECKVSEVKKIINKILSEVEAVI